MACITSMDFSPTWVTKCSTDCLLNYIPELNPDELVGAPAKKFRAIQTGFIRLPTQARDESCSRFQVLIPMNVCVIFATRTSSVNE